METKVQATQAGVKPRNKQKAVNVVIDSQAIEDAQELGLTVTGVTSSATGILYYDIPVFRSKFKVSYSTICRNIQWARERRDARLYFVKVGNKNYVSCGIIGSRRKHSRNFTQKEYKEWFSCYQWDVMGGVSYENKHTEFAAKKKMERLFRKLQLKYYDTPLVFLYASEPNASGDGGYHNHFLLGYQGELASAEVKGVIEYYLRAAKEEKRAMTKIEEYRWQEDYLGYIVNKIDETPDGWDILTSNIINN